MIRKRETERRIREACGGGKDEGRHRKGEAV